LLAKIFVTDEAIGKAIHSLLDGNIMNKSASESLD
jgi:hypothetical protein